jgi:hypothetical protein
MIERRPKAFRIAPKSIRSMSDAELDAAIEAMRGQVEMLHRVRRRLHCFMVHASEPKNWSALEGSTMHEPEHSAQPLSAAK